MALRYGLGDSVSISTYFGSVGEIGVNTTTNTIHIFDSVTEGGISLAKSSDIEGAGLSTVGFSTGYGIHIDPIGTGVTFSEDLVVIGDARVTGVSTLSEVKIESGSITNLTTSGIGTITTSVIDSAYVNTGIVTTISGTTLNYSGLSTVANFKIAPIGSGATVGSSGIVTYYGDGSQLTGVGGELDITSSLFI